MPNGPTMRPIATRCDSSPSNVPPRPAPSGEAAALLGGSFLLAGGLALATLDDFLHRGGRLCAQVHPVRDAIERDAELLLGFGGLGVVVADALDEAPVARHARIGDDDVVEGAVPGSATRHSDDDQIDSPSG